MSFCGFLENCKKEKPTAKTVTFANLLVQRIFKKYCNRDRLLRYKCSYALLPILVKKNIYIWDQTSYNYTCVTLKKDIKGWFYIFFYYFKKKKRDRLNYKNTWNKQSIIHHCIFFLLYDAWYYMAISAKRSQSIFTGKSQSDAFV